MLAIVFNDKKDRVWHIGNTLNITSDEIDSLVFIQADGHELDHIKSMFANPDNIFPKGRVIKLYGDLAKTIVANL